MKVDGFLTDSYQTELNIDGFEYTLDRTEELGGLDSGTSPHGMLVGSVAGCKLMVAKGYLDFNKIAYENVSVHAESQILGEKRNETIEIAVEITVEGAELNDKMLRYLTTIVEKGCTMANILTAGGKNKVTVRVNAG